MKTKNTNGQKRALAPMQAHEVASTAGAGKTPTGSYKPTPPSGPCFPVAPDI